MKKIVLLSVLGILLIYANAAQAASIFTDTFTTLPNGWTITGTVTTSTAGISPAPNSSPVGNPFAVIYSSSTLQRTISTTSYQNILMRYYRTPINFEASGGGSDYFGIDWKLSSAAIWTNLETLDNSPGLNNNWNQVSFNLPASANNSSIDVRFRVGHVTGNDNDYGLLDNFELLGDSQTQPPPNTVPEPATMSLLGLGLIGIALRRKNSRVRS